MRGLSLNSFVIYAEVIKPKPEGVHSYVSFCVAYGWLRVRLSRQESRAGALCAIFGSVLLLIGTYLHPMGADPNEAVAAFTEYAADHLWVASHLTQLAGVALMAAALLFLAQQLVTENGIGWARVAAGGVTVNLAVATVLQAVDGVALKIMVDVWACSAAQKEGSFRLLSRFGSRNR